jgi:hypothetical protein
MTLRQCRPLIAEQSAGLQQDKQEAPGRTNPPTFLISFYKLNTSHIDMTLQKITKI